MRKLRLIWSVALLALLIVACSGPGVVQDAALLSDADLDAAELLPTVSTPLSPGSAELSATPALDASARTGSSLIQGASLDAAKSTGQARGQQDLGGFVAYVEQSGKNYAIRLVDLNDENSPERRGDYVVYSGQRAIQSVAVSRDGQTVAFVAQSKDGDNDVYLLDAQRNKVSSSRTPGADERDVSMSLHGEALAWQGGSAAAPSLVWFHPEIGAVEIGPAAWQALFGRPMSATEPSISGDGFHVTFVETSGNLAVLVKQPPSESLASLQFGLSGGRVGLSLSALYLGDVAFPSLSYDASKVLFYEVFGGTPYLSIIDREAGTLTDVLANLQLDHPFLTADGDYGTFSYSGDAFLVDLVAGTAAPLSPNAKTTDTATYWARGNFTSYSGSNDQGTFVRPDDGGTIDAAGRTVGYHVFEFRPISDDFYSILSVQDYDGYLNLYVDGFDPSRPERNLIGFNDDYLGSWDAEAGLGRSRIVAALESDKMYYVVTSACGAPGTPCGPSSGNFENLITDGAPPPVPPTQLPEPDDSRFNITLRFWNDSLTDAEKAVFETASDRWSEVITGDVQNIPNFALSETQVTSGAPGIVGELDDVVIDAAKVAIDGPGGTLARAGAFYTRSGGDDDFLPVYGIMEFDEAEFGPGQFFDDLDGFAETIMHEMGHVLGISRSFWIPLGYISGNPANTSVCSDVANGDDPRYEGPAGNDAWTNYYGADSDKVPIANTNGCGTADSHWREIYLQDEIMTGYAQGGGEPLSRVTIGALQDLGYVVNFEADDQWSIPALPTLTQVSPNPTSYRVEFDFTSAYTNSLLDEVQAPVTPVDLQLGLGNASTSGCEAADFAGFPAGNIALLQRGACNFGLKAANALAAGATGVLIGNQGDTEDRKVPTPGTFGDDPIAIVGVPISYDVMVELANTPGVVVAIDTDTSDDQAFGPQALPRIVWHIAEELLPLRGAVDMEGNVTNFDD